MCKLDVLVTMFPHSHVHQSVLLALLPWSAKGVQEAIVSLLANLLICLCTLSYCVSEQVARGKTDKAAASI